MIVIILPTVHCAMCNRIIYHIIILDRCITLLFVDSKLDISYSFSWAIVSARGRNLLIALINYTAQAGRVLNQETDGYKQTEFK
jgi:hypothetical protein